MLRKCWSVRCGADRVSARWRIVLDQPSPAARPGAVVFVAVVAHARYGHPLRFYIRPHFGKCGAVVPLKLHLVHPTAARPDGFPKQALCKVAFTGGGRTAIGAFRSLARPTRRRLRALVGVPAPWHWSGAARFVLLSGLRPFILCLPRPPCGLAAARLWPARSARPPPRGSLSQRACGLDCYKFRSWSRNEYAGFVTQNDSQCWQSPHPAQALTAFLLECLIFVTELLTPIES